MTDPRAASQTQYHGVYNGYQIAERLLEDVMFDVKVELNRVDTRLDIVVSLAGDDRKYVAGLGGKGSVKRWCEDVKNDIEESYPYSVTEMFDEVMPDVDMDWILTNIAPKEETL